MTDAVLSGSYAGFRLVKTRRVVVVEIEVPIEALQRVLDVLGTPDPATETPVAIARLTESAAVIPVPAAGLEEETGTPAGASRPPISIPAERVEGPHISIPTVGRGRAHHDARPPRPWHELTRAQQAGIRCGEKQFREFTWYEKRACAFNETPEAFVRRHCGVASRAELNANGEAAERWDLLDAEYRSWAGLEAEPR